MPAYGSQLISNTPLQSIGADQVVPATLFSNETPATGTKSLACVLVSRSPMGEDFQNVSVRVSCPAGIGAGELHVQTADVDSDSEYTDEQVTGAGKIVTGSFNAFFGAGTGTARAQLQITRSKFLRIFVTTVPGNPITVTVV